MENVVSRILSNIEKSILYPNNKRYTYIIGNNGTGKSRLLRALVDIMTDNDLPALSVLCISNTVYDRFNFINKGPAKYLGQRNVSNAVFHAKVDRQLIEHFATGVINGAEIAKKVNEIFGYELLINIPQPKTDDNENRVKQINETDFRKLFDNRKIRNKDITEIFPATEMKFIWSLINQDFSLEKLNKSQASTIKKLVNLNPLGIKLLIKKSSHNAPIPFSELSSGEQNKLQMALKIYANLTRKCVVIIDEPEISLHLHWQLDFHNFLRSLTDEVAEFHAVIATHSPVVISEAAKDEETDAIIILNEFAADESQNQKEFSAPKISFHCANPTDIQSYDDVVIDFFRTSTYKSDGIDKKIARALVSSDFIEGIEEPIQTLETLKHVKGIDEATRTVIEEAITLVKKFMSNQ